MKALLWKDYRQNRALLVATTAFIAVPYAFVGVVMMIELAKDGALSDARGWPVYIHIAAAWSWGIAVVLAAFFAGHSMAGERGERSAEFIAYLPVSRRSALLSKAAWAMGGCLLMWLFNLAVHTATGALFERPLGPSSGDMAIHSAPTAVLLFGVAWFFSSFLHSAANSAACGLLSAIVLAGTLVVIFEFLLEGSPGERGMDWFPYCFLSLSLIIGIAGFAGGVAVYLRRVEP